MLQFPNYSMQQMRELPVVQSWGLTKKQLKALGKKEK
jgi:hypothetical protein